MNEPPASTPIPTTEDAFLGGRLNLLQPVEGPRAGVDAVFLAAACPAKTGETVLDAGTGSGVVALAIARRVEGVSATGVDIDPDLLNLAQANARANGLNRHFTAIQGDVTGSASALTGAGLIRESFDHVVANPPFLESSEARIPPGAKLQRAHALEPGDLERWIKFLASFCRAKGSVTLVHRADALPKLLGIMQNRFGGLIVYPLFPREGRPASRVILHGRKGSRAQLQICRGMILHNHGNSFTPEADAILRGGARLELCPGD